MERVASLILNLRNGTEDESATNVEHRGAHGDAYLKNGSKDCDEILRLNRPHWYLTPRENRMS